MRNKSIVRLTQKIKILYHTQTGRCCTQGLSEMAAQEGERMDKGELTLYRNTYNAGKRDALEEYADRMKKSLKRIYGEDDVPMKNIFELLDQYLKEALAE